MSRAGSAESTADGNDPVIASTRSQGEPSSIVHKRQSVPRLNRDDSDNDDEGWVHLKPQPTAPRKPRHSDPLAGVQRISAWSGFLRSSAVISVIAAVTIAVHILWLSEDDFGFWDMTPRRVARPQAWTMWDGSDVQSVRESALCFYRMACASFVFWTVVVCVTGRDGIVLRVSATETVRISGFKRLSTFSMIAWTTEGVFFVCASLCHFPRLASPLLARWAWVLFEICSCTSLLVFFVVRLVLIPYARKAGLHDTVKAMNSGIPWTVHNVNVAMLIVEYVFYLPA